MRRRLRQEQIERHARHHRASFAVTPLQPKLYPPDVPRYYSLMFDEFLERTGTQPGQATARVEATVAQMTACAILDSSRIGDTDLRIEEWRNVCRRTETERACMHCVHSTLHERSARQFDQTPNAAFYDHVGPAFALNGRVVDEQEAAGVISGFRHGQLEQVYCTCASDNTIMLCNNQSHVHSADDDRHLLALPEAQDVFRECCVTGHHNQNIVSCNAMGERGSRERWMTLTTLVAKLYWPTHGSDLCNSFDDVMAKYSDETDAVRGCLAQFTFSTYSEATLGKDGDRELPLIEHARHRLRLSGTIAPEDITAEHLDWYHPHRVRVNARNAILMTLSIQLFADATEWRVWCVTAWTEWSRIVLVHCTHCYTCRAAMIEGLAFVFFCSALHPISQRIIANIEQLLAQLKRLK
jgi:hypothetical protein